MILKSNRYNVFFAIVFAIINYLIVIQVPNFTTKIIDNSINSNGFYSTIGVISTLPALVLLFMVTSYLRNSNIMLNNVLFCNKLEKETFLHLLRLPYKFFEIRSSGDILYRMSSLTGFRELFSTQIIMGIIDIGTIGFIFFS